MPRTAIHSQPTQPPALTAELRFANPPTAARLAFLDGIRCLAAIYVVIHHCVQFTFGIGNPAPGIYQPICNLFAYGDVAVAIFIWLSGIVLALPVIRAGIKLKNGAMYHYKKRARRILPAYYLAMAISLLLIASPIGFTQGNTWDLSTRDAFTWQAILSHVFLIHAWTPYAFAIDSPMWSLSWEWQIYLGFPLIVWFWRRFGVIALCLVIASINLFTDFHLPLCFCAGILTAQYAPEVQKSLSKSDLLLLKQIRLMLEWRPLSTYGGYSSYSLYLLHVPILAALYYCLTWALGNAPSNTVAFLWLIGAGLPIAILTGYAFSLIAEKPWMNNPGHLKQDPLQGLPLSVSSI